MDNLYKAISVSLTPSLPVKVTPQISGYYLNHTDLISAAIDHAMKVGLIEAGKFLTAQLAKSTPTGYTGNARKGWKYDETPTPAGPAITIYNPFEYLLAVDQGRKAAWVNNMPPAEPLTRWVQKKLGIKNIVAARGIAFVISRKKHEQATPGQRFVDKCLGTNQPKAIAVLNSHVRNALKSIGVEANE